MNAEWSPELRARAAAHAALGEPLRLAVVERLVLGDVSPGELGQELGVPSNLLAHHLKTLDQAGLLDRVRSAGDHRRTYLRLRPAALAGLMPTGRREARRVVFVCSRNSARSQLAAALWRRASRVPGTSAGTHPADAVHPLAEAVARERGVPLGSARPQPLSDVLSDGDLVVAVCDNAHEELPPAHRLHWSVPDPAVDSTPASFTEAFDDLAHRIDRLAPAVEGPA